MGDHGVSLPDPMQVIGHDGKSIADTTAVSAIMGAI